MFLLRNLHIFLASGTRVSWIISCILYKILIIKRCYLSLKRNHVVPYLRHSEKHHILSSFGNLCLLIPLLPTGIYSKHAKRNGTFYEVWFGQGVVFFFLPLSAV